MRRTYPTLFAFAPLFFLLLLFGCTSPQKDSEVAGGIIDETETTILAGLVVDSTNTPVSACSVWVRPTTLTPKAGLAKVQVKVDSSAEAFALLTDESGAFEFIGIPAGSYTLMVYSRAVHLGFQQRITLTANTGGNPVNPIMLNPLQTLSFVLESKWIGDSIYIPELELRMLVTNPNIQIPEVPAGSYTIRSTAFANDTLVIPSSMQAPSSNSSANLSSTNISQSSSSFLPISTSSSTTPANPDPVVWDLSGQEGSVTDSRDGSSYRVTTIDTTVWFAANLHYALAGSSCNMYDILQTTVCTSYGRYYTFSQANQACPAGWHVPTLAQWQNLFVFGNEATSAGLFYKNATGWNSGTGYSLSNFNVMPYGSEADNTLGIEANFWTSTATGANLAQKVQFTATSDAAVTSDAELTQGLSVRCVQN